MLKSSFRNASSSRDETVRGTHETAFRSELFHRENIHTQTIHKMIRDSRTGLGMTQFELAHKANISLALVQLIEAGKGNPSLSTLDSILKALSLKMEIRSRPARWDLLARYGVPLMEETALTRGTGQSRPQARSQAGSRAQSFTAEVIEELRLACRELTRQTDGNDRKKEAIQAFLLAIKSHYPTFYADNLAPFRSIHSFLPGISKRAPITGRIIKLRRQALAIIATYL